MHPKYSKVSSYGLLETWVMMWNFLWVRKNDDGAYNRNCRHVHRRICDYIKHYSIDFIDDYVGLTSANIGEGFFQPIHALQVPHVALQALVTPSFSQRDTVSVLLTQEQLLIFFPSFFIWKRLPESTHNMHVPQVAGQ